MKFRIGSKIAAAFGFICLIFSFSAIAQTDSPKPMSKQALTALIAELKGVVSNMAFDDKAAKQVAAKWDKRKDLSGKTKSNVIDLLYDDAKAVITDSGIRYQIYSTFAFYKSIPDEFPAAETKKPNAKLSKAELVENLIEMTVAMHPYIGIEEQLSLLPGTNNVKAAEETARKQRFEGFDDALKVNEKLTPEQKEFVRANYDLLSKSVDKITEDAIKTNFPAEKWIKEALEIGYTAKFTVKDLASLNAYFKKTEGQRVLMYIRNSKLADLITRNGGTLDFTDDDKGKHDNFVVTSLGKKFLSAFVWDASAYEELKESEVRSKNPDADGFAIFETENLNKLFNQFVFENYKK